MDNAFNVAGLLLASMALGVGGMIAARGRLGTPWHVLRWMLVVVVASGVAALLSSVMGDWAQGLGSRLVLAWPTLLACGAVLALLMACGERWNRGASADLWRIFRWLILPAALMQFPLAGMLMQGAGEAGPFNALVAGTLLSAVLAMMALGAHLFLFAWLGLPGRRALWTFAAVMGNVCLIVAALVLLGMVMMTHDQAGPAIASLLGLDIRQADWSLGALMLRWFALQLVFSLVMAVGGRLAAAVVSPAGTAKAGMSARGGAVDWSTVTPDTSGGESTPADLESIRSVPSKANPTDLPALEATSAGPSLAVVFPTRVHYAVLALLAAIFVFYASLIPMEYRPLAWEEAVKRFSHVQYYELGIDRRADVLANLVLIVPVTFLAMAALHKRGSRWARQGLNAIVVAAMAGAYVVAIEFTQEWFPPRTISQNDMQAGAAGALVGIILWLAAGEYVTYALKVATSRSGSPAALRQVLWLYLAMLAIYLLFPMDFTISPELLREKYQQGRIVLLPWIQGKESWHGPILAFGRSAILFLPVGVLLAWPWGGKGRPARRWSLAGIALLATAIELMRLPVFSNHNGLAYLLGRFAGGAAGLALAQVILDQTGRLALGSRWPAAVRRKLGFAGALGVALMSAAALLYPYRFNAGRAVFRQKLEHFLNWPFQWYYWAGEWTALSKVVICMALFAGVGMVMRWGWNTTRSTRRLGLAMMLAMVLLVGLGVEIAQAASGNRTVHALSLDKGLNVGLGEQAVNITDNTLSKGMLFSIGQVSDVTDLLAYLAGAGLGWVVAGLVLPRETAEA